MVSEVPQTCSLHERLHALAAFLPDLERPGFKFGRSVMPPGCMPHYRCGSLSESLQRTCYDMEWVVEGFDWGAWKNTPEALQLRDNPDVLEHATPEQLAKLLTVLFRQERFDEGTLEQAYESGLLVRILRRAVSLERQEAHAKPVRPIQPT
jgi:hypothetical protein